MVLIYHLFRFLFWAGIRIAGLQNGKARRWWQGRKDWDLRLKKSWNLKKGEKVIWMHCASVGEFEQGRPLLESIRKDHPEVKLLLTFFSPSGFDMHRHFKGVDHVAYLPFDGKKNAEMLIDIVRPTLVIFIKYEFWYFYLKTLRQNQIPTLLVSGLFRPAQPFFQRWGSFHRSMLTCFTHFFLQDEASVTLLRNIGITDNVSLTGDTRFDRVAEIAMLKKNMSLFETFAQSNTLVAGSTWPEDEALLKEWHQLQPDWKLMIVPHEISETHLLSLKKMFPNAIRLTEIPETTPSISNPVLIVDTMGLLSSLYKYAALCYVGGGLKKSGHHNILEAAVYGKAVITGPCIHKFSESIALHKAGGSFTVINGKELWMISADETRWKKAGQVAASFVQSQLGATEKIIRWIQENRLLSKA
jgi:3-deoxy-D-manno-octulosonic-acid transferase